MNEDKCEKCGYYGNYCDGYSSSCEDSKKAGELVGKD